MHFQSTTPILFGRVLGLYLVFRAAPGCTNKSSPSRPSASRESESGPDAHGLNIFGGTDIAQDAPEAQWVGKVMLGNWVDCSGTLVPSANSAKSGKYCAVLTAKHCIDPKKNYDFGFPDGTKASMDTAFGGQYLGSAVDSGVPNSFVDLALVPLRSAFVRSAQGLTTSITGKSPDDNAAVTILGYSPNDVPGNEALRNGTATVRQHATSQSPYPKDAPLNFAALRYGPFSLSASTTHFCKGDSGGPSFGSEVPQGAAAWPIVGVHANVSRSDLATLCKVTCTNNKAALEAACKKNTQRFFDDGPTRKYDCLLKKSWVVASNIEVPSYPQPPKAIDCSALGGTLPLVSDLQKIADYLSANGGAAATGGADQMKTGKDPRTGKKVPGILQKTANGEDDFSYAWGLDVAPNLPITASSRFVLVSMLDGSIITRPANDTATPADWSKLTSCELYQYANDVDVAAYSNWINATLADDTFNCDKLTPYHVQINSNATPSVPTIPFPSVTFHYFAQGNTSDEPDSSLTCDGANVCRIDDSKPGRFTFQLDPTQDAKYILDVTSTSDTGASFTGPGTGCSSHASACEIDMSTNQTMHDFTVNLIFDTVITK